MLQTGSDALLFTNADNQVVFVDANVLLLLKVSDAGRVVGEPLHAVLGVDQPTAADMLKEVAQTGVLTERPLAVRRFSDGSAIVVRCLGVATYDAYGRFIGADLTIRQAAAVEEVPPGPAHHADSLRQLATQAQASAGASDEARLLAYFTTHLSAIEVMLARMGGFRIRDTLEKVVNQSAQRGGWPVSIASGQVTVEGGAADPEAYRSLLAEAMRYAIDVTARRVVLDEMQSVDAHMDPGTLAVAEGSGLLFGGLVPGA